MASDKPKKTTFSKPDFPADYSTSSHYTYSSTLTSSQAVDKPGRGNFQIEPDLMTPTHSLQDLENMSKVSLGYYASADEEVADEVKLIRPRTSIPCHTLDSMVLDEEEKSSKGDNPALDGDDDTSDEKTPTQTQLPYLGDLGCSNVSLKIFGGESASSYSQIMRGIGHHDDGLGLDVGFEESPVKPLPHIFDVLDDERVFLGKSPKISVDDEKATRRQDEQILSALDLVSIEDSKVRETQPHPLADSIDMTLALDRLTDANMTKPPLPKKSSRRRLAPGHLQNTVCLATANWAAFARDPEIATNEDEEASIDSEENFEEDDPFHRPHHDLSKPLKKPNIPKGKENQPIIMPSAQPKLHPQVVAAETRIAAYKASAEYTQRNKDLLYINQHKKAKKATASADHQAAVQWTPPTNDRLFCQAQSRITEMSVNGAFRAMLKDATFVRMYKDEMLYRRQRGVWWEGWRVIEELKKHGFVPAVVED